MQFRPDQALVHMFWVDGVWMGFKLKLIISHTTLILSVAGWNLGKWLYGQKGDGATDLQIPLKFVFSTQTIPGQISGGNNDCGIHGSTLENVFHI